MSGFGRDDFERNAGEQPFDNDGTNFVSEDTRSAIIEARESAAGFPRSGLALVQNGTSNNGDLVSYSHLTPNTPIVFPVNTQINEITFSNNRNSVECDLEIWDGGVASGTLVKTVSFSTGSIKSDVADINVDNLTFTAGNEIQIVYVDQGTNARDMVVVLWISRIP